MSAETVLVIRLALHIATLLLLARYYGPSSRFRGLASVCAGLVMAYCATSTVSTLSTWPQAIHNPMLPWLTALSVALFVPVALARGNMAVVVDWLTHKLNGPWRTR